MNINNKCTYDVLLWIYKNVKSDMPEYKYKIIDDLKDKYSTKEINCCVKKLNDNGFIEGIFQSYPGSDQSFKKLTAISKITNKGYKFFIKL